MEDINDDTSIHPLPINTVPVPLTTQKNTGTESNAYKDKRKVLGYKKKTVFAAFNKSKKHRSYKY